MRIGEIGENAGMDMAVAVERRADRADASVHHVGKRDDVGAGFGMAKAWRISAATVSSFIT